MQLVSDVKLFYCEKFVSTERTRISSTRSKINIKCIIFQCAFVTFTGTVFRKCEAFFVFPLIHVFIIYYVFFNIKLQFL